MYTISDAEVIGVGHRFGRKLAEVKVTLSGSRQPLLALLDMEGDAARLHSLLQWNEDREVDWYDNDLHLAFVELDSHTFATEERENLLRQILSLDPVRSALYQQWETGGVELR